MLCKILKSFPGSQDGSQSEQFHAGTVADLSPYLMSAADPTWFAPVEIEAKQEAPVIENKAIDTDGKQPTKGKKRPGDNP